MKATIDRPTPPPVPPATITIELSETEARRLRALCGSNGCRTTKAHRETGAHYFDRVGLTSEDALRKFMADVFYALERVVPQEQDGGAGQSSGRMSCR